MNNNYEITEELLIKNNQIQVLNILKNLDETLKEKLVKQILELDFDKINELYKKASNKPQILEKKLEHIDYIDKNKILGEQKNKYVLVGEEIIKKNQYAVVTMAGGQGTRLGHNGPKGTFKLDVKPTPKYLFQILAENLIKANTKYNITLNWYIMTSTENNDVTIRFFKEHNYFGYPSDHIKFFKQGDLPLLLANGNLIINDNYSIKYASDGNGSIYKSMLKNGVLKDMENKGIKWIFIGSVDNALLDMVDPILLGLTKLEGNEIGSKSVCKKDPSEKVGVFCKANGVPSIIEYSELPKELAEARDEYGELLYGEANIMCHLYTLEALKRIADETLEYHVANKKSNYMDENGKIIEATNPNAYKFETFIFDAFSYFSDMSILRVSREENFAPVKNKEGIDSPETAIKLYNDFYNY